MACEKCYEVEIPECPIEIKINAGLTPGIHYFIRITDKFKTKYNIESIADVDGNIAFDATDLPAGIFNRHAGSFTIEVRETNTDCEPESMMFCCDGIETSYSCIIMSFFESGLGELPTEIGCEC